MEARSSASQSSIGFFFFFFLSFLIFFFFFLDSSSLESDSLSELLEAFFFFFFLFLSFFSFLSCFEMMISPSSVSPSKPLPFSPTITLLLLIGGDEKRSGDSFLSCCLSLEVYLCSSLASKLPH